MSREYSLLISAKYISLIRSTVWPDVRMVNAINVRDNISPARSLVRPTTIHAVSGRFRLMVATRASYGRSGVME